jgi:hypothetical protein
MASLAATGDLVSGAVLPPPPLRAAKTITTETSPSGVVKIL